MNHSAVRAAKSYARHHRKSCCALVCSFCFLVCAYVHSFRTNSFFAVRRNFTWDASKRMYIYCNAGDWSCQGHLYVELARVLARNGFDASFQRELLLEDLRPRIFFVGADYELKAAQRNTLFWDSDLRVLLHVEPYKISLKTGIIDVVLSTTFVQPTVHCSDLFKNTNCAGGLSSSSSPSSSSPWRKLAAS